jgi:endonuclease-3
VAKVQKTLAGERARAEEVRQRLREVYPEARCSLDFTTPLDLLVATILSAQCTDERVNMVTKDLFKKYRTCEDYLRVPQEELENDIHSCGFYRQKTKSIRQACRILLEKHGGVVPGRMDDLLELQGVGRKTANVLLANCFGHQAAIVDTHVRRVSQRLGFTKNNDPDKIEQDLMRVWPRDHWTEMSHLFIFHGRSICVARGPRCDVCPVRDLCPYPDSVEGKRRAKPKGKA